MKRILLTFLLTQVITGCAVLQSTGVTESKPEVTKSMMKKEFDEIPPPAVGKPVSVAVYSFQDKTGQRRPTPNVASLSTAVTQGGETFLIQALQNVGQGRWFEVVERVGIDNLTKERLIIRQMREAYEGSNAKQLMPMQFAGMIIEGGIIGYDSSTNSGGIGHRYLGIGKQTQWTQDVVTVSLRAVSVNTGRVLLTVTVQKTILSSADSISAFKFFDAGTKAFEAEAGLTINEPGTYAVKSAVEAAVVELIKEGQRKGVWNFKTENSVVGTKTAEVKAEIENVKPTTSVPNNVVDTNKVEIKEQPKQEIKPHTEKKTNKGTILNWTKLRTSKDALSNAVLSVKPGTEVELLNSEGEHYFVRVDKKEGWVGKKYIRVLK